MQAITLPAKAGWRWLPAAFVLFRRNPGALIGLTTAYWGVIIVASLVPVLGAVLGSVIGPALSIGVMNACRQIDRNQPVEAGVLFSAFRHTSRRTLFALGALYLGLTLGILMLTSLIDDGLLLSMMTGSKFGGDEASPEALQTSLQVALVLMAPVIMAWWYAPMLAAWNDTPLAKALFFSFIASWRNWRAFLTYGLAGTALIFPVTMLVVLLASSGGVSAAAAMLLFIPAMVFLAPLFFASFYVSYRDVFVVEAPPEPTPGVDLHV